MNGWSAPGLPDQPVPPDFRRAETTPTRVADATIAAIAVHEVDGVTSFGPGAADAAANLAVDLDRLLADASVSGAAGAVTAVPVITHEDDASELQVLLLAGAGSGSDAELRRAGAAVGRRARDHAVLASAVCGDASPSGVAAFVNGLMLGSFEFHMRSRGPRRRPVGQVVLCCASYADGAAATDALDRSVTVARAGWISRALATVPANVETPRWLADQALALADEHRLRSRVWDRDRLQKGGFGGIVGVGSGSEHPPYLVQVEYRPRKRRAKHVVLVGKGVTFDTGGLTLKTGQGMMTMKRDMSGAAAVLGALSALRAVECPVRVTALLPIAENAVGADSLRPGDVITHYGGRTIEVNNTDAEGRLLLADALAYAVDKIEPDVLVDVATLTGGIKVALGQGIGGLFATHDVLADAVGRAGSEAGEPLWRMPLDDTYAGRDSSAVADAINAVPMPQAIVAALFLRPFTGGLPWVHLDLASVGDVTEDHDEWTQGPSGFGARLLATWLGSEEPLAGLG